MEEITATKGRLQQQYNKELAELQENTEKYPCRLLAENILNLNREAWELINPARQKDILGIVIKEMIWDGRNIIIHLQAENNLQKNSVQDADKDGAEVMNCL